MKATLVALMLLASAGIVLASSPSILYTRTTVPSGWTKGPAAPSHANVEFTFALKQRNLDILNKWFWEVSDPTHKNYQDFKTIDEITDLVSPKPEDTARVMKWLLSAGVHHRNVKNFGDALDVRTTVKNAQKLFNTKFHTFTHAGTGAKIVRAFGKYSVPASVKDMIEIVTGISAFPIPHLNVQRSNKSHKTDDGVSNDYGVVPQTISNLYSITQEARKLLRAIPKNGAIDQSVVEFQDQSFAPSDLLAFGQGVSENVQVLPAGQIIGPNDPTDPGREPSLDIQMIAGVNLEANNWFWLENGTGWLYQFAVHFFGTANVPLVNSISYGWWEGDQCTADPDECSQLGVDSTGYVLRVNTEFQKIGARGISLLASSGDSGANGRSDLDCTVQRLRPSFPASSPYITSVGATEMVSTTTLANQPPICEATGLACAASGSEQAVSFATSRFASGGGFSDINPRPAYQEAAVDAYFNSGVALPGGSYFNASGRAHPDVAAVGHNLLVVYQGAAQPAGGTSASCPIFAAIVSLLNAAQIEKTGKPFGFLNPFLYQMHAAKPTTFNDITVGDNKCTENGCAATCEGYLCAPGWDPVTGLGTPNFANMLAYVQSGEFMKHKHH